MLTVKEMYVHTYIRSFKINIIFICTYSISMVYVIYMFIVYYMCIYNLMLIIFIICDILCILHCVFA